MGDASVAGTRAVVDPVVHVPRTWVVMAVAITGAFVGLAAVYVWEPGWDEPKPTLAHSGPYLLFAALVAAQTMVWALALWPLGATFRRHWRSRAPDWRWEVLPSAAVLVLLIAGLVVVPHFTLEVPPFIPRQYLRIALLTSGAGILGLVAATTIWLIRGRANVVAAGRSLTDIQLRIYLGLRSDLQTLLGFLGAMIGLAVLASAALVQVVQEYADETKTPQNYPPERVILYGLVLSLFVALVYLPTWMTIQRAGSVLRDETAPMPGPWSEQFAAELERRARLDDLLGLRVSASVSFRAGVAILSPLLASLTTLLPHFGG